MKTLCFLFTGLVLCLIAFEVAAAESLPLDSHLEPLRPWLGKTWKGHFKTSTPELPVVDIARWEQALNGKAVRILHSVNEGAYGGESIIMWDKEKQVVAYHYFTTGGFTTTGTMIFKDGKILTSETISGNAGGVTEVRGTTVMQKDGSFLVKTEHRKSGEWTPGRETLYREDARAKVVFK